MMKSFILTVLPALMMAAEEAANVDVEAQKTKYPDEWIQACAKWDVSAFITTHKMWMCAQQHKNGCVLDGSKSTVGGYCRPGPKEEVKTVCEYLNKAQCEKLDNDFDLCEFKEVDEQGEVCTPKGGADNTDPVNPDNTDNTKPDNTDNKPDNTDNKPDNTDNKPDNTDNTDVTEATDSNAVAMGLTLAGFLVILQL